MIRALALAVGAHAAVLLAVSGSVPAPVVEPMPLRLAWAEQSAGVSDPVAAIDDRAATPTERPPEAPAPAAAAPPRARIPPRAAPGPRAPFGVAAPDITARAVASGPTSAPAPLPGVATPPPAYPPLSRARGEQGSVGLEVRVAPSGAVERVEVTASSGHPRLDTAARDAVAGWRFRPALADGAPVAGSLRHTIHFRLDAQGMRPW